MKNLDIAVCDTCTLIQLRKGGILDCLTKLFDEVYLPKAVAMECQDLKTLEQVKQLGFQIRVVNRVLPIGMGIKFGFNMMVPKRVLLMNWWQWVFRKTTLC